MPELSDLTPARLAVGETTPVPDTELTATLEDYRFARGLTEDGKDTVIAWARIRLEAPDGRTETVEWDYYQPAEAMGQRFYLGGSRSEVLLYALPGTGPR